MYDEGDRSSKREDEISSPHEKGAGENATRGRSSPKLPLAASRPPEGLHVYVLRVARYYLHNLEGI